MKQDQATFYNLKVTTADGQTSGLEYLSETQCNKTKANAAKMQSTVEELKAQTFLISTAESIDEILMLTPNPEVALSYYNYGLTLAQHNVKRELMTDPEWQVVDGAYDLLADVQEPKEKRVPDPLSASRKSLKALWAKLHPGAEPPTDDEINAVLASFAGVASQPAAV